jgi:hypothetical protein
MKTLLTKDQTCKLFGCTTEQLNKQYAQNAIGLQRMLNKAIETKKKVNGYSENQLKNMVDEYNKLSKS